MSDQIDYVHVDVFTPVAFSGNSLAVFPERGLLSGVQMQVITQEVRHFESIFLSERDEARTFDARVFSLVEELDFAGHPVIGAACALHAARSSAIAELWTLHLKSRTVTIRRLGILMHGIRRRWNLGQPYSLRRPPRARGQKSRRGSRSTPTTST